MEDEGGWREEDGGSADQPSQMNSTTRVENMFTRSSTVKTKERIMLAYMRILAVSVSSSGRSCASTMLSRKFAAICPGRG